MVKCLIRSSKIVLTHGKCYLFLDQNTTPYKCLCVTLDYWEAGNVLLDTNWFCEVSNSGKTVYYLGTIKKDDLA